jgi:hypothetical protein
MLSKAVPFHLAAEAAVPKRECMNIKVDAELVRKAKVIAAARHVTLSDYISRLLRGLIDQDLASVAAGLTARLDDATAGVDQRAPLPSAESQ